MTRCLAALVSSTGSLLLLTCALFTWGALHPQAAHAYLTVVRQGEEAPEVPNAHDWLGWAVAAGDFNGDGYDDLAAGAPGENEGLGPHEHGAVTVNFGSARGITLANPQWLTVGDIDDTIVHYGIALAVGNFNGDAYDDLAVGLPDFDGGFGAIASAGRVWVHLGGATGLNTVPIVLAQSMASETDEALDRFGAALTAGDFNGDGFDDLAVGCPGEDAASGAAFVFRGGAGGIAPGGTVTLRPLLLGSTPQLGGEFGSALAAGDLYDSHHVDLAIGAPQRDVAGQADAGQVYVVRGSASGILTTSPRILDYDTMGQQNLAGSGFGASLAVGRFKDTEPTRRQLAIGEPGHVDCVYSDCGPSGRVFVLDDFEPPYVFAFMTLIRQSECGDPLEGELNDRFGLSLAAGDWDDDGLDDLAVGTPGEDIEDVPVSGLSTSAAGQVYVWRGGAEFGTPGGFVGRYHGRTLNDTLQTSAQAGWALAFGRFDDSGRANLAIGAPTFTYRDYMAGANTSAAGQVYVLAPWRQITDRPHRSSVALDCEGQLVFAQRPHQVLAPASITKAMTVLLACEAIQQGDIDSNAVYVVPDWVATNVSGSQAGLVTGQSMRFVDLMKLAIAVSAGDACYAIGDMLTGGGHAWNGLSGTLPEFNAMMNARAAELGMTRSAFNNPSGRPLQGHFMTALDWARFVRVAMDNPLFRYFVGTRVWADIPNWPVTSNGWLSSMQDSFYGPTDGLKPGGNELAMLTGLWSAEDSTLGRYVATALGVPSSKYGAPNTDSRAGTGADLLGLAITGCSLGLVAPSPTPEPPPWAWGDLTGIPTGPGPGGCLSVSLEDPRPDNVRFEVVPQSLVTPNASFVLRIGRSSELVLGPGESATIGITPIQSHDGFRLFNQLSTTANVRITTSSPIASTTVAIPSEGTHLVPARSGLTRSYSITVQNVSSTSGVRLQLDELGYVVPGQVAAGSTFAASLSSSPRQNSQVARCCVDPGDPVPGNLVYLVLRPPGGTVDVETGPSPVAGDVAVVRMRAPRPNPSAGGAALAVDMAAAGPLWMTVHDLAGRSVRTLESGAWRPAGTHVRVWDGRDAQGRRLAAGVYFVRVRTDRGHDERRVIRLE